MSYVLKRSFSLLLLTVPSALSRSVQQMQPTTALYIAIPAFCETGSHAQRIVVKLTMQMPDDELDRREITTGARPREIWERQGRLCKGPINGN